MNSILSIAPYRLRSRAVVVIALCAALSRAGMTQGLPAGPVASCPVETRAATRLGLDDGRLVYVEPSSSAGSGGAWAVAGEPTYAWRHAAGQQPSLDSSQALLGVLVTGGSARPLPKPPVSGVATHPRLIAEGSGYRAVFAETDGSSVGSRRARVLGYWSALFDGAKWSAMERLPLPPGTLDAFEASQLVRVGAELMLAVPYGAPYSRSVAVYSRSNERWAREDIYTKRGAYLALAAIGATPLLYLVRPDSTRLPDENSIFLFRRESSGWRDAGIQVGGGRLGTHRPGVSTAEGTHALAWHREDPRTGAFIAEAAELRPDGTVGSTIRLANAIEDLIHVHGVLDAHRWIVTRRASDTSRTVALISWNGGAPRVSDAVADPYTGPALARAVDGGTVVMGPLLSRAPNDVPLVSGMLRLTPRCNRATR